MIILSHMINNTLIRLVMAENMTDTIKDGLMNNQLEEMIIIIQHSVDLIDLLSIDVFFTRFFNNI